MYLSRAVKKTGYCRTFTSRQRQQNQPTDLSRPCSRRLWSHTRSNSTTISSLTCHVQAFPGHACRSSSGRISFRDLQTTSLASEDRLRFQLGCLERWGFIYLQQDKVGPAESQAHSEVKRDGWGSGRGIKQSWFVHLARRGSLAGSIWPKVWPGVEERWK